MVRLTIFIIALLLAVEAVEPEPPWLVTLAVLSGIELLRIGPFRPFWPCRRGWRRRRLRAWVGGPGDDEDDW